MKNKLLLIGLLASVLVVLPLIMGQTAVKRWLVAHIQNFGGLSNSVDTDLLGGMASDVYNFDFRTSHVMEKEAGLSLRTRSGFELFGSVDTGNVGGLFGFAANGRIEHVLMARGTNLLIYNTALDHWMGIDEDIRAGVCSCTQGNDTIYGLNNTTAWFGLSLEAYTQVTLNAATYSINTIMSDTFLVMKTNFGEVTSATVACTLGAGGTPWVGVQAFNSNDPYSDKHGVMFGDTLHVCTRTEKIAYGGNAPVAVAAAPQFTSRSPWDSTKATFTLFGSQGPPAGKWAQITVDGTTDFNLAFYCLASTGNSATFYCDEPLYDVFIGAAISTNPNDSLSGSFWVKENHDVDALAWDTLGYLVIDSSISETIFTGILSDPITATQQAIQKVTYKAYGEEREEYTWWTRQVTTQDSLFLYRYKIFHTNGADPPANWPIDSLSYMTTVAQISDSVGGDQGNDGLINQKFPIMMDTSKGNSTQSTTLPGDGTVDTIDFIRNPDQDSSFAESVNTVGDDANWVSGFTDTARMLWQFTPDTSTITGQIDSIKIRTKGWRTRANANGNWGFRVVMWDDAADSLIILDTNRAPTGPTSASAGWDTTKAFVGLTNVLLDTAKFGVLVYQSLEETNDTLHISQFALDYYQNDQAYAGVPYLLVSTYGTKPSANRKIDSTRWFPPLTARGFQATIGGCTSNCPPVVQPWNWPLNLGGVWELDSVYSGFCVGERVQCNRDYAPFGYGAICFTEECSRSAFPLTTTSSGNGASGAYDDSDSLVLIRMQRNSVITRASSINKDTTWHYPIVITMMDRLFGTGDTNTSVGGSTVQGGPNRVAYTNTRVFLKGSDVDTSVNFFYVESALGEVNTALSSEQNVLYVHKPSGIWSVPLSDGAVPLGVFPTKSRAGALSMRGITSCWRGQFFVSYGGVYQFQRGGDTQYGNNASSQIISEPINQFWIDSLDRARLVLASVSYSKRFDRLYVSVTRKSTQSALLGNDVTLVYDFRTQLWSKYNIGIGVTAELAYPGKEPILYFGSPKHGHGQVLRFTENPQDSGQVITSTWSTGLLALAGVGSRASLHNYFIESKRDTASVTIFRVFVDGAATARFVDTLSIGTDLWETERRAFPDGLTGERFTFKLEFQADTSLGMIELSGLRIDYRPTGETIKPEGG